MRVFIAILVLIFSLQSLTKADDISDFEIEGMSIGDSLLNFINETIIKNHKKYFYPASKKYYRIDVHNFDDKFSVYDAVSFHFKNNDEKYIITSISGRIAFNDELEKCMNQKKKIIKDIKLVTKLLNEDAYEFTYPQLKDGKAYVSEFIAEDGAFKLWCTKFSKEDIEKNNAQEGLSVTISSKEHLTFLRNDAYK